jgi:hypothetical protein
MNDSRFFSLVSSIIHINYIILINAIRRELLL